MKTIPILLTASLLLLLIGFSSCEHKVHMETTVHADGSLDKTIVLEANDTIDNFLGIGVQSGWKMKVDSIQKKDANKEDSKKWKMTFEKSFASAEEANKELATPNDSLFRVSSRFEKSFRWFYTYIYYSDTYHAINRMELPIEDYFTPEDQAFIERLPAEGTPISKADSLYLKRLHEKIFDIYALRAFYERYFQMNITLMSEAGMESRWIDSLRKHKEDLYGKFSKAKDIPDDYLYRVMDSLKIPFPYDKMQNRYEALKQQEEKRMNSMNHAFEGKYTHVINMPGRVARTNADSVAGNRLFWKPATLKFTLHDYTMYAEARRMNLWAVGGAVLVLVTTVYLFIRRPRAKAS
jgi:hypothetical protein